MNSGIKWDAYIDFWYWINQRHSIYLKKKAGEPKPWSNDPIFQHWKFCNVFRKLDKQTQWLFNNVIRKHFHDDPSLLLFNIFQFRAFNWYPTYEAIGWSEDFHLKDVQDILRFRVKHGEQLTSGAYMIRGYLNKPKWQSIPETLAEIWNKKDDLLRAMPKYSWDLTGSKKTFSLQDAYETILWYKFWGWGPFTSYQIVLDLNLTPILANASDLNTWCSFGPGAKKGLREIWPSLPLRQKWMLEAAKSLLADQVKYREPHVPELNLQDIEFCLCELGKYRKIKAGGRGKEKYAGT